MMFNIEMDNSKEIRLKNARLLRDSYGSISKFADVIDRAQTQVSRFMGKNPTKSIGDELARHIEGSCGKPRGWLDQNRKELSGSPTYQAKRSRSLPLILTLKQSTDPEAAINDLESDRDAEHSFITPRGLKSFSGQPFAVYMNDGSMQSSGPKNIPEGSLMIFDAPPPENIKPGKMVIAKIQGSADAIVRVYKARSNGAFELAPLNDDYSTTIITSPEEGEIIGQLMLYHVETIE